MTRVFFSAGDPSGDIHGGSLIRAMREVDPSVECAGLGGQQMAAAGLRLDFDLAGNAIMGFVEVVKHFRSIRKLFHETVARIERERPASLVVIDYPGFNVQLAKRANQLGIPVVWYISPQVWAWKKGRVRTIARVVRKMLVILPFEQEIYRKAGVDCTYVGHPLVDHIAAAPVTGSFVGGSVIALMPGSREQEIGRHLGVMLEVARGIREQYSDARFVVPCVNASREAQVRALATSFPIETAIGQTCEILHAARFCLVASGTATVETTLFGVPMIILYKVAPLTYALARLLVHVDHIGMVNILAGRRIVPEFIQSQVTASNILPEALALIEDGPRRTQMIDDLARVRDRIGGPGASRRAAAAVLAVARGGADG